MELTTKLLLEQKLIMTQEMQLKIKLLQMNNIELSEFLQEELVENPVIELSKTPYKSNNFSSHEKSSNIGNAADLYFRDSMNNKTLKEFLYEQLREIDVDDITKLQCEYLIENIDEKGYLETDVSIIYKEIDASIEAIEKALAIIQSFDPPGVGARNIKECLVLQLLRKDFHDEKLFEVVNIYLEDIPILRTELLAKELGIKKDRCQEIINIIKTLEPKPARGFYSGEDNNYLVPDAYVKIVDGEKYIYANSEDMPSIRINSLYKKIEQESCDDIFNEYVKEKFNRASYIIRGIEQRNITLKRVLEGIVIYQRNYFYDNTSPLIAMTLKDIAERLDLHISTVSRATSNKYINCSRGTIKLKNLFTKGYAINNTGMSISAGTIKAEITKIINEENIKSPISDEKITNFLNISGMNISRRTVAKYREELGIKSSTKRKRGY